MSSLSLREWKNWHVPRVEISIITQDRPRSLQRLLASLSQARFFGDSVGLRMHMEQSSDLETIRVVSAYQWNYGSVFMHRRVVHGGLLPAVVESWYPHSNDSYGLILEDDIELSPLFTLELLNCLLLFLTLVQIQPDQKRNCAALRHQPIPAKERRASLGRTQGTQPAGPVRQ
ncbi:hypothetical protein C8R46DRAFT_1069608 [Mycena filopes]|nr:hypothetical protein C8R46DRAFT_1069608 [Mycena filopes]